MLNELKGRKELICSLVGRELKSRYKGSSLGLLWSLLTPLFMAVIYAFFFRFLVGRGSPTESIIVGVFAWQFTASTINSGMVSISGSGNLIKKVAFPRVILPLAVTLAGTIDYLISLVVQLIIVGVLLAMKGQFFGITILALPLVLAYHICLNLGLAMLVSSLNVYFRDTQHLIGVLLTAFFFLSPAMYDLAFIANNPAMQNMGVLLDIYMLNPMASLITAYRACFLPDTAMIWTPWAIAGMLWPILFVIGSGLLFRRLQKDFADYV